MAHFSLDVIASFRPFPGWFLFVCFVVVIIVVVVVVVCVCVCLSVCVSVSMFCCSEGVKGTPSENAGCPENVKEKKKSAVISGSEKNGGNWL